MAICRSVFFYSPLLHRPPHHHLLSKSTFCLPKYPSKFSKSTNLPLHGQNPRPHFTSSMESPPGGYRKNVGICLINPSKKIFAASRLDIPDAWQMPQGGIDESEDPKVAAIRELKEETGVSSAEVLAEVLVGHSVVGLLTSLNLQTPSWLTYDFPPEVREKLKHQWGSDWKGQAQKWFLLKFTGNEEEINLLGDGTEKPEFGEWSWMSPEQIIDRVDVPVLLFLILLLAQNMQKKDSQFQLPGICRRLFNFFVNNFIARPFNHISGRADAVSRSSTEGPVDDSLTNGVDEHQVPLILKRTNREKKLHHQDQERSKDTGSGSEIQVHLKQTEEELEHWIPVDNLGSSVHEPVESSLKINDGDQPKSKKGDRIPISLSEKRQLPGYRVGIQKRKKVTEPPHDKEELPRVQVNGITTRGKAEQETDSNASAMTRGRGPKKFVTIQDSKVEDRAKKGKNIISENSTLAREHEAKEVFPRHLISVASNINEKSDAFIQRKKEAMRRNLSLERKKP
ncbi:unnamed protein product [Dovyalis caffra]|uniref:Nudix hydrolase domain-containing protein n=1 Tax=Dovyalis caffra TaxID=77055 RepID=A0AAV1QXB4_9ROSI|nr:unnamed protein product [Dovyalis caffra]